MEPKERSWSKLPGDIVSLIESYLLKKDCVKLASTCKSYQFISAINKHLPPPQGSLLSQTPCLLFSTHKIHHPIYTTSYQMGFIDKQGFDDLEILESNYGWFLAAQSIFDVFFYNPITKVKIYLPEPPSDDYCISCVHFTSPPTSMDCRVLSVSPGTNGTVEISTIRPKQKSWTTRKFPALTSEFSLSSCNPIFYKGVYYCVGNHGNFLRYDPTENQCSISKPDEFIREKLKTTYAHKYMVESDGELLVVFVAQDGRWVGVYRLDVAQMRLEMITCLGNQILYVSNLSSFSETATLKGTENKIHLPLFHGEQSLFYSLDTNKFHTYLEYATDNLYGTKTYPVTTWIKPTFYTSCSCSTSAWDL